MFCKRHDCAVCWSRLCHDGVTSDNSLVEIDIDVEVVDAPTDIIQR